MSSPSNPGKQCLSRTYSLQMMGYLDKQCKRRFRMKWCKLWFTLENDDLRYAKYPRKMAESKSINCNQIEYVRPAAGTDSDPGVRSGRGRQYVFEIVTRKRFYLLAADSEETRQDWLDILNKSMNYKKKCRQLSIESWNAWYSSDNEEEELSSTTTGDDWSDTSSASISESPQPRPQLDNMQSPMASPAAGGDQNFAQWPPAHRGIHRDTWQPLEREAAAGSSQTTTKSSARGAGEHSSDEEYDGGGGGGGADAGQSKAARRRSARSKVERVNGKVRVYRTVPLHGDAEDERYPRVDIGIQTDPPLEPAHSAHTSHLLTDDRIAELKEKLKNDLATDKLLDNCSKNVEKIRDKEVNSKKYNNGEGARSGERTYYLHKRAARCSEDSRGRRLTARVSGCELADSDEDCDDDVFTARHAAGGGESDEESDERRRRYYQETDTEDEEEDEDAGGRWSRRTGTVMEYNGHPIRITENPMENMMLTSPSPPPPAAAGVCVSTATVSTARGVTM